MNDDVSERKPKVEIGQSAFPAKITRSTAASVYLSSEEVTFDDKKSARSSVYKSSEKYYEYLCNPCITVEVQAEAEGFCTDCNEYLCTTCFRSHSRSRIFKHHVLLSKNDMPRKSPKFCKPCDDVSERKPKVEIGQSAFQAKITRSTAASVYLSSEEVTFDDKKSARSSVYKSSEEYYEYLCNPCITVEVQAEAEGFCTNCNQYLCTTCFRSHSRSRIFKHHVLLSKNDMPRKSPKFCKPCKVAGDEIKAVGSCKDCCDCLCNDCFKGHARNKFTRHHVIVKDEAPVAVNQFVTSFISNQKVKVKMTSEVNTSKEYSFNQDVYVKADTDEKDCYVTAMTSVSDNELVLCDANNQCLKLVDISKNIIKDILAVQSRPLGITTISNDQIVFVLSKCYKIQLVKVREQLTLDRSIKTNGNCVDVTMLNNQLYVSYIKPVRFQILQLTGEIIKTIRPDDQILKHCHMPRNIAVSYDGCGIYVSDWETNKIMSLDLNGNILSLYQSELEIPYGIITSPSGSVFVCNRRQNIVYKMKSDLSNAIVILGPEDGLVSPHAMCFDKLYQNLYISGGAKSSFNAVKIYKCCEIGQYSLVA